MAKSVRLGDTVFIDGQGFSIAPSVTQPIQLKPKRTFVSGGGGGSRPQSTLKTPTPPAEIVVFPHIRPVSTVTAVPTISLANLRQANLQTAQRNALIELRRKTKFGLIPIDKTQSTFRKAQERSQGTEVFLQTLSKKQAKLRNESERRKAEGKASPGKDLGINALGVPKAILKVTKTTQDLISGIPSLSKSAVSFVGNKPLQQLTLALKGLPSDLKISRRKTAQQLKSNPIESLGTLAVDYYLLGGRTKGLKKALIYEAPNIAKDNTMKGIYLKAVKGERPVLFKYKRGEGVKIADVKKVISKRMTSLRKGKKLEITSKTLKPRVINLGNIKPPKIPKGKPKALPPGVPSASTGGKLPPKKLFKKKTITTEAGDKLTITRNVKVAQKQAEKNLKKFKQDLARKNKKISLFKASETNLQAIRNLRKKIKSEQLRKAKADKLFKKISSRKQKLSKLELKQLGFKVKALSKRQQLKARSRGKKFLEKETKVLRKKTKKELEEERRLKKIILETRKKKAKLQGLKVKVIKPRQQIKAKARGKTFLKKESQAQVKKDILQTRARTFKVQKKKVSNIQNLALKRFKEQNKKQLKKVNTKADAVKVIETNIKQMKSASKQVQQVRQQLKQVQVSKTTQKQVQQKVFIINDKLVKAQKKLNALKKKKNVSKSKLIKEVQTVQSLKNNMFNSIAGASGLALSSLQKKNISTRISDKQKARQQQPQKPRSAFVENTAFSQAEKQVFRQIEVLRQRQIKQTKTTPKKRIRPKVKIEKRKIQRRKQTKKDYQVFDVYGKSGNKFVKMNKKPLMRNDALSRGSYGIDHSTARTFKVVPKGRAKNPGRILKREKGYYPKNKQKFRDYKIKKGKALKLTKAKIERKGKPLIDTRGEKKGLTLAKLIKKNNYKKR